MGTMLVDRMESTGRATAGRRSSANAFEELQYVFTVAGTTLLKAEEERELAERLWQSRRRVRVAMVWLGLGRTPDSVPELRPHATPFSPGLRKRLLRSEKEARELIGGESGSSRRTASIRSLVAREIATIDETREALLRHNLRLVAWIAKGFQKKGLDLVDLFQEGALALLWSIDRYDPARDTRLSTFASYAIKLGIIRALADKGRAVRIPNYRLKEVVATTSARTSLLQRLGREPRLEEIEKESDVPRESLEELLSAVRPTTSIDAPLPGTELALSDVLLDQVSLSPFELLARSEAGELANRALRKLTDRERKIVSMRYGIGDDEQRSYEDIGRSLGLSRERTRQLEASARGKLRSLIESGRH